MSEIVGKLVKPATEILAHVAKRIPPALAKAHHRIGQMAHDAADHFDNVETDLAGKARIHSKSTEGEHLPHEEGPGASSALHHKEDEAAAGGRQTEQALHDGDPARAGAGGDPVGKGKPLDGRCTGGDPIDLVSGEALLAQTDVELPGVLPLVLRRTHLSGYRYGRLFGRSWASTLDERLEADGQGLVLATEDGMLLSYPVPRPNVPTLPAHGPRWPLLWDGTVRGVIRVTDPEAGVTRHFSPPDEGSRRPFDLPLTAVTDRNLNRVTIDRDVDGVPTAVGHSGGYRVRVETEGGRVTALRLLDAEGRPSTVREFAYSPAGDLTHVVNASGRAARLSYDEDGRIAEHTDREGRWYRFTYDENGRCVTGSGLDGFLSCSLAYDTAARTTEYTDSLGRTSVYRHDEGLRLVESTNALGQSLTNAWDADGRLLSHTDALGNTTRCSYDAAGNLAGTVLPDGGTTEAEYDDRHQLVRVVTPDGSVWRHTYDDRGNETSRTDPTGATTGYAYDATGGLTAVTDAAGRTRRFGCDAAGLPVESTDPLGASSRIERDDFGNVTVFTDELGRMTRYGWTVEGEPLWCESPDGGRMAKEYDAEGHLVRETDQVGDTVGYEIGPFGQVTARTLGDGSRHLFAYDTELNLVRVTEPSGRAWSYAYDEANNLVAETDFDGRELRYEVDAAGGLAAQTNGAGETVTFERDRLGRTVAMGHDGHRTQLVYDSSGNLVRESGAGVTVERVFDVLGQLVSESVDGRTTGYAYDELGRRTERRTPAGTVSRWAYDDADQPVSLDLAGHRITFGFDAAGQETGRRLPGGVTLAQSWDRAGRLTDQSLDRGPEGERVPLQRRTYSYRPDDVPTAVAELTTGTRNFTLDAAGRVLAVDARGWTERYAYDAVGNLSRASTGGPAAGGAATGAATSRGDEREAEHTYAGTRVRRAGRTTYEHDAEGRVVRTVRRLLNGRREVRSYQWDSLSRLVGATTPSGDRWRYSYDPAGRRVAKRRLDAAGETAEETLFVWDGTCLIEQIGHDGRVTSWEYEPDGFVPVAQLDQDEVDTRFRAIVADLSGAPAELVRADGELVPCRRTTLWGAPLPAEPGEGGADGVECPLRFPGQYADAETGWHYNLHRHYDPRSGRYTAPDPLGLDPSPNDTAYVSNPFVECDPLGLARTRAYTRKTQYPSGYRQGTHDHMVKNYTDEGRAMNGVPFKNGKRVPRHNLTWRDDKNKLIWKPGQGTKRDFSRTVTYEHSHAVVKHWNKIGRNSNRATRNDFYNTVTDNKGKAKMFPMEGSLNSSGGGKMKVTYNQQVGPGYTCR